ncbi:MAG: sigma 54-interacting transcriptional regulator [Clostridiales bacterium]|nr:sigma 54-interacting transcriptional regulator [Clostridiales bacterium]
MVKIAIIIPKDLVKVAESAASGFLENIHIIEGSMEKGLGLAKEYEEKGYDVIIARGGTQLLLKDGGLNVPTVPIPITVIDIFNAVKEAEKFNEKIAIIAFDNMVSAIETYIKVSGTKFQIVPVANEKEVEGKLALISSEGVKVAIGGGVVARYGIKHGIKPIVIKTGKEAIISAIEEARRVAIAMHEENKKGQRFRTIVENSRDGIISVDKDGYLNIFNSTAEKLLNINGMDVIGMHIDQVLPQLELTDVLSSGIGDMEVIKNIRDSKIMVSNIPVKINGEVVDGISMLQDVNNIQRMEEKIRKEIYTTGLYAKYTFNEIIGVSKETKEAVRIGKEYAKVNSTILIEGETGTGKEVMAQSIHNYSHQAEGPFVAVNCAALPENLLESELFGYAPGSFTGADKKGKRGLFELAHRGTIFLDEICEMNPLIQGRLLRVLQEKQVMRIGDNKVIPIDVRVITATNRNLHKLVQERKFREDLFYRLNVLKIVIPPLRKKHEDIPYLIEHFIQYYSQKLSKPKITLSNEVLKYLSLYNWPGNIRELRNFVERLMVVSKHSYIELSDIEGNFIVMDHIKSDTTPDHQHKSNTINFKLEERSMLVSSEKEMIINALEKNLGIINFTAKELGISRTTLWRKMKKYNLDVLQQ